MDFDKHRENGIKSLDDLSAERLYPHLFYTLQGLYSLKKTARMTQDEWHIIVSSIHRLESILEIKN